MKCYHSLYMSEKLVEKKAEIIRKIENDEWQFEKYIIALTQNEKNHLEFYNSVLLIQKAISKEDIFLVGIADGYDAALGLVQTITEEVYANTKGLDIRNYLLDKQREYEESNL